MFPARALLWVKQWVLDSHSHQDLGLHLHQDLDSQPHRDLHLDLGLGLNPGLDSGCWPPLRPEHPCRQRAGCCSDRAVRPLRASAIPAWQAARKKALCNGNAR